MTANSPIVIIGSGHAGYTLAREFRRLDADAPMVIISEDDGVNYYKPNLSKALATGKTAEDLVMQPAEKMAETLNARLIVTTKVTDIDAAAKTVRWQGGEQEYSRLVLATGAQQKKLPLTGSAADQVLTINNLSDYARFRSALKENARVAIIVGGLIGCEFANDLISTGYSVSVIDICAQPLPRLLPAQAGDVLRQKLAEAGVNWHLQTSVISVNQSKAGIELALQNGETIEADIVISAIGLAPNIELAQAAGVTCTAGINVDATFQTNQTDIFALGDCIQIGNAPMPYILPIANGARALAKTLSGEATPCELPVMPVMVKTPSCPILLSASATPDGKWLIGGDAPDLECVFVSSDGIETGFALLGEATKKRGEYAKRMPPVGTP